MDYSYIPQLYQQGLQSGLDKQFKMATSAQPVEQFLQALRQRKADELAQQAEMDRQRRLDIEQQRADQQAQYQNANSLLAAGQHFSAEISPENVDAYRTKFAGTPFADLIPKDTMKTRTLDYGPDQGTAMLGEEEIPLTPKPSSFEQIIKPTGTNVKIRQDAQESKERMAAARLRSKEMLGLAAQEIARGRAEEAAEMNAARKAEIKSRIDKRELDIERAAKLLELGEPERAVELLQARTAQAYGIANSANSQVPYNEARTDLAGAQQKQVEKRTENMDVPDSEKERNKDTRAAAKKKGGLTPVGTGAPGALLSPHAAKAAAMKEWDALPAKDQTPAKKAELKKKYGI